MTCEQPGFCDRGSQGRCTSRFGSHRCDGPHRAGRLTIRANGPIFHMVAASPAPPSSVPPSTVLTAPPPWLSGAHMAKVPPPAGPTPAEGQGKAIWTHRCLPLIRQGLIGWPGVCSGWAAGRWRRVDLRIRGNWDQAPGKYSDRGPKSGNLR